MSTHRAFVDESSALREPGTQEYLIGAAVVPSDSCDGLREQLQRLKLPGQIKLHWRDESEQRRKKIVDEVQQLEPLSVVITHRSERQNKTERFRRLCLGDLYNNMLDLDVHDLVLESRGGAQDKKDVAHIVALQNSGLDERLRIAHKRGGDEPLLWIADVVLGAINAHRAGNSRYFDALSTLVDVRSTESSLMQ
ncbi:hypothetical protein FHX49_000648 [Microbacterium endophyticum]|uniref:DUF3800 domain-containing protein n=1 Tax=Microbacterium endophyticum TaxID=1526412 RepID=A0A7W4V1F7_9MICO|nr:hypothetical protein [Microbacterium endophyticum]MBB2975107.1 hypothetical protein [Microbacterium endophyticum]